MKETEHKSVAGLATGAVVAALGTALTTLCCLPFAAAALGASALSLGSAVAPWRPVLVGAALALLVFAWVRVATRRRCEAACSPPRPVGLLVISVGVVLLLTMDRWSLWLLRWLL